MASPIAGAARCSPAPTASDDFRYQPALPPPMKPYVTNRPIRMSASTFFTSFTSALESCRFREFRLEFRVAYQPALPPPMGPLMRNRAARTMIAIADITHLASFGFASACRLALSLAAVFDQALEQPSCQMQREGEQRRYPVDQTIVTHVASCPPESPRSGRYCQPLTTISGRAHNHLKSNG